MGGSILTVIRVRVATPAVRQKRSKLAPTASQASVTRAVAAGGAGVVILFMALLSFEDLTPRAYRFKAGNADQPMSTSRGASPPCEFIWKIRDKTVYLRWLLQL